MPSWGPYKVIKSDGKVKGMELIRCTSVFDNDGCFAPTYDSSVKEIVEADQIIMAVGYTTDFSFIDPEWSLTIDQGLIVVDQDTQATSLPGVFAGGSVTSGPATVIEALAAGKRAAVAIDLYLKGAGAHTEDQDGETAKPFLKFNSEYLQRKTRVKRPKLPVSERRINVEDALELGSSEIKIEVNRCFNCGCVSVDSSDIAVALLALEAKIKIAGSRGVRTVPIKDFFAPPGNIVETDEMITEIQVSQPPVGARQTFLKFRLRKAVDFPIISVASIIIIGDGVCKDARIALGAVAPCPIRAMEVEKAIKGKPINLTTAKEAAEAAIIDAVPLSMNAYKVKITKTLVERAILS